MEEYKPNSHKYKEAQQKASSEEKKIEKVVSGTVRTKKKSDVRKLADIFISEDVANVKSYILMDVLVPAIKKAISDIVTNGIDMILYGGKGGDKTSSASKVSYKNYYDKERDRRPDDSRNRSRCNYDDIILDSRGEAEEVLSRMDEIIDVYKQVSVADLYDLVGITDNNFMNNKYGWIDIRSASVIRVRNGYLLKLPKALPLD